MTVGHVEASNVPKQCRLFPIIALFCQDYTVLIQQWKGRFEAKTRLPYASCALIIWCYLWRILGQPTTWNPNLRPHRLESRTVFLWNDHSNFRFALTVFYFFLKRPWGTNQWLSCRLEKMKSRWGCWGMKCQNILSGWVFTGYLNESDEAIPNSCTWQKLAAKLRAGSCCTSEGPTGGDLLGFWGRCLVLMCS